ncbi:MAG TPA: transposase [bacterium]|nr:transposase [bacterium]
MPRVARIVVPEIPHHITQRGNRSQQTFFNDDDYRTYIDMMAAWLHKYQVQVWAYCLMPNHVHMIVVPPAEDVLRRAIGEAHRRYTCRINQRNDWRGHLWQGRFASFPMDESHLLAAARYVELNPVRAGLVRKPWRYRWSSAAAHIARKDDRLVIVKPLLDLMPEWDRFIIEPLSANEFDDFHKHECTGRPIGSKQFVHRIGALLNRDLQLKKPGPKNKNQIN